MSISASQVKELRERTGAGMMECKKALVDANGDIELAIETMRKAGQAKAAKKAGRTAAEGIIAIKTSDDNKTAFMVEINTETDFAAKDASFKVFVDKVVNCGLAQEIANLPDLLATSIEVDSAETVATANEALISQIGENIQIRRVALLKSDAVIGTYCHAGRIGVLVKLSINNSELGKDLAMHIAASKPEVVAPEEVSPVAIEKEQQIYLAQIEETGKPKEIAEKIVAGKIKKFINEISLSGQPFVKDPSITVGELLNSQHTKVLSFVRFEVGEGIEKEITDFAKEVMEQVGRT